jgi:hypothetical protein
MDPLSCLSVAASVIQVVGLGSRLVKCIDETSFSSNAQDYMRLSREVESLNSILEKFQKIAESTFPPQEQHSKRLASQDGDPTAEILWCLNDTMDNIRSTLVTTEKSLAKKGMRQRMRWKLLGRQKSFNSATQSLRQSKDTMSLLVTMWVDFVLSEIIYGQQYDSIVRDLIRERWALWVLLTAMVY